MAQPLPTSPTTRERLRAHGYAWWRLSLWSGIYFGAWWRILARNGFRVSAVRIPRALVITLSSLVGSAFRPAVRRSFLRRGDPVRAPDPVVIIGHWRTGTTFLHDLLASDPNFAHPSVSAAFMPHYPPWLVSFLRPLARAAAHGKRPMDNVVVDENRPQEDEFSLLLQGSPSPYEFLIFPGEPRHRRLLTTPGYAESELRARRRVLSEHVRRLAHGTGGRRLILKSPTYTGQIDLLLDLFPDARFIHLVRHPDALLPSTMWMVRALQCSQGLQTPNEEDVESFVIENLKLMYDGFRRHVARVPEGRITRVRYEDLVEDPLEAVRTIGEHLDLASPTLLGAVSRRLSELGTYVANTHEISDVQRARIREEWGFYFRDFGYSDTRPGRA